MLLYRDVKVMYACMCVCMYVCQCNVYVMCCRDAERMGVGMIMTEFGAAENVACMYLRMNYISVRALQCMFVKLINYIHHSPHTPSVVDLISVQNTLQMADKYQQSWMYWQFK